MCGFCGWFHSTARLLPEGSTRQGVGYEDVPILNSLVLHTPQVPCVAGLPFFKVTAAAFWISFLDLHLKQYASIGPPYFLSYCGR